METRNQLSTPSRSFGGVLHGIIGFTFMSAVAGALIAALFMPLIFVTGVFADVTDKALNNQQGTLTIGQRMEKSNVYATRSDGTEVLLASFYDQNRVDITYENVGQVLKDAAVATEDPRYFEHSGVDFIGTARAIFKTYVQQAGTQGGSTITQQYVKNALIQDCETSSATADELEACAGQATESSGREGAVRKLTEMRLAVQLEKDYTKEEILLGYLNIAGFGARVYGVEAASRYYFNASAATVNVEQAATLIAILNNPSNLRIDLPNNEVNGAADGYAKTKIRRDYVLNAMLDEGKLTAEQHAAAIATPITPVITQTDTGCDGAAGAAYFCDYVTWVVKNNDAFGDTPTARANLLRRGGLQIHTTLDMDLQAVSEKAIADYIPQTMDRVNIGAATVTVEPGTGRVLAMAQNKTFTNDPKVAATSPAFTSVNYNTDRAFGGSSGFQVGSSYKAFILLDWLQAGHPLNDTVKGTKQTFNKWVDSCSGDFYTKYSPQNYNKSYPRNVSPLTATKNSINTAYVAMASELDLCSIHKTAEKMGVHRADGEPLDRNPGTLLGANEIAPVSLASAFAGIASQGVTCQPIAIDRVESAGGETITPPSANCGQTIAADVANAATHAMQTVFEPGGTARKAVVGGAPLFGKTGTSDDAQDSWLTGGTTEAVTSLWVGNVTGMADGKKRSMYDVQVKGGQTGFSAKFPMWKSIMGAAVTKFGGQGFAPVDKKYLGKTPWETEHTPAKFKTPKTKPVATPKPTDPATVEVPSVFAKSAEQATAALKAAGFTQVTLTCVTNPAVQPGKSAVNFQEPAAGQRVLPTVPVTLRVERPTC